MGVFVSRQRSGGRVWGGGACLAEPWRGRFSQSEQVQVSRPFQNLGFLLPGVSGGVAVGFESLRKRQVGFYLKVSSQNLYNLQHINTTQDFAYFKTLPDYSRKIVFL